MAYVVLASALAALSSCESRERKIAKKWMVQKVDIAGTSLTEDMLYGFYFDISPTGSYKIKGMSEETGSWKLQKDSIKTIEDKRGRAVSYYIQELTDTKLVLVDNTTESNTVTTFVTENK